MEVSSELKGMYIYALPLIAGLIGWFTNFLAVKLLFHPRKAWDFHFFKLQGVFPKRQALIAEKIGRMVADELLSIQDIKEKVADPDNIDLINRKIEGKLDEYLVETFPNRFPLMAFFVGENTRSKLKGEFIREIDQMAPEVIEQVVINIENNLDIEATIIEKVNLLSPIKLEELIMGILKKEFKFIELIGFVIGVIVGLLQVVMVQMGT